MIIKRFLIAGFMAVTLMAVSLSHAFAAEKVLEAPPAEHDFKIAKLGTSGQLIDEYKLSKYDVLNIVIIGFPDGIGVNDIMVGPDGYVQLPYAGMVKLAGLTIDEASQLVKEKLGEYIKIPSLSVMVKSYGPRKIYVMGEVQAPGIHELPIESMNVFAAISKAGGIATHGRPRHVQLIRVIGDTMYYKEADIERFVKKHDINQNLMLQDGDIVYVPTSNKIDLKEDILPYISVYGIYKNLTD